MENKKSNKGLIALVIILIVIILGLGGYIAYDVINSNNKENTTNSTTDNSTVTNNTTNTTVEKTEEVPDTDLYIQGGDRVVFVENSNAYLVTIPQEPEAAPGTLKTEKITGIEGKVNKVRAICLGTSADKTVFCITEEGKVFMVDPWAEARVYEEFKKYNVKDIISGECENMNPAKYKYTLLLKNDKKIQLDISYDSNSGEQKITETELK